MQSEHSDEQSAEQLQEVDHPEPRIAHRRISASPDVIFGSHSGHTVNRKRVYRLYKEERLMVRRHGGRKRAIGVRSPMPLPGAPNQRWSLDFVHDQMTDGRRLRILAVVDDHTRECLALVAEGSERASHRRLAHLLCVDLPLSAVVVSRRER